MYKGIYIALSGAITKQRHMDIFSQNIANVNTAGYKKERIAFKDFLIQADNKSILTRDGRAMSEISHIITDFSSGNIEKTGNPLDLAIDGRGFFVLEEDRYTRAGNFRVSGDGYLVTQNNVKVLGNGGPVSVRGGGVNVSSSGEVFVDGVSVDKLKVVDFSDKGKLEKSGNGIFVTDETGEEIMPRIRQGYLETSNVEIIKEMVRMITAFREFESYQKMIHAFDEATAKVINEMGKR